MNGKDISWLHSVRLFEEHCELSLYSPCPNLTRKHVHLASFNYTKVNLAAQVLSGSVGNAIADLYGSETSETVRFIKMFNNFSFLSLPYFMTWKKYSILLILCHINLLMIQGFNFNSGCHWLFEWLAATNKREAW